MVNLEVGLSPLLDGRSKRDAPGSTDTSCSTTGGACLRVEETPRRAETEAETGLRTRLILRSLERQLRGVPAPFVGCLISCDAVAVTSKLTIFIWFSPLFSIFFNPECLLKNLLITTYFLSSEATHSCMDWLRKVRTPAGGWTPSKTEGKNEGKKA